MDPYQRGRSPSAGARHTSAQQSRSPSGRIAFDPQVASHTLDPANQQHPTSSLSNGVDGVGDFMQQDFAQPYGQHTDLSTSQQYMQAQGAQHPYPQYDSSLAQQDNLAGLDLQNSQFDDAFDPAILHNPTSANNNSNSNSSNPSNFTNFDFATPGQEPNLSPGNSGFPGINASMQPTSMPADMSFPQDSFAFPTSSVAQSQPHSESAPRHQSLSPSSAAHPFGQAGREWSGMTFRGHRRNASDAYSDISSSAANPSPYIDAPESFDHLTGNSPSSMNGQADPTLPDTLGLGTFTLSEGMQQAQHISPGHSNHPSPRVSPQQDGRGLSSVDGLGLYPSNGQISEQFPGMGSNPGDLFDSSHHLETPEINIQFAPERQPAYNEPGQPGQDQDALSPPARGQSRPRGRAISDPYSTTVSRGSTPNRNRAPSLSLHPHHSRSISRSSSPGGPPNGITKPRDRASSTSAVPAHRERMIGLADPERNSSADMFSSPGLSGGEGGPKRTQKHPATFQCTLCPKRFTRAYNLRSHLRTHTDERPFVCTVCGKAFARQHDRKRHEGLHSGEKKFVCKGLLAGGSANAGTWGCGRRFARADALGRHFRSEAGRTCIKPLLDEEARERRALMMEQQNQNMLNTAAHNAQQQGLASGQASAMAGMGGLGDQVDVSNIALPAALLAQYPALAGIQWDALPAAGGAAGGAQDEDDFGFENSGRSSFEASSGGEFDFEEEGFEGDESWNVGVDNMNDMQQQQQQQQGIQTQSNGAWNGGYVGS